MTEDLDHLLGRLAARPPHAGLEAVSLQVMERVANSEAGPRHGLLPIGAAAAVLAVAMGIAGGWVPSEVRHAPVLDAGHALAPSTLLGSG